MMICRPLRGGSDFLFGGAGNDQITLWDDGSYVAYGGTGDDILYSFATTAVRMHGENGNDALSGSDVDDQLFGGHGNDTLEGGAGDDRLFSGYGNDVIYGGLGNDIYVIGEQDRVTSVHPQDVIFYEDVVEETATFSEGDGVDTVISYSDHTLGDNFEILRLRGDAINGKGNSIDNTIVGNARDNDLHAGTWGDEVLIGNDGNDALHGSAGDDLLSGGSGDDELFGSGGRDLLSGGSWADTFYFHDTSKVGNGAEDRDFINDFERGVDRIALFFDANIFTPVLRTADNGWIGNDDFDWIGRDRFSGAGWGSAGELRYMNLGAHEAVIVEGDTDGDGAADFQFFVNGLTELSESDFLFSL